MTYKDFLCSCSKTKVLLIGDIMLDKYVIGNVNRISPEAPVPIFLSQKSKQVLGGAGNVYNNLISLGVKTTLISAIGKDTIGVQIEGIIKKIKNNTVYLFKEKNKVSTVKTRYSVNGQQLIRVDDEDIENFSSSAYKFILRSFKKEILKHNVIILSDYNKGIFNKKLTIELIRISNKNKIPIIIDPKNKDFRLYQNAFLITPNQLETTQITNLPCNGNKEAELCGEYIINKFSVKNVLITRGAKGLTYISKKESIHANTKKVEVFDVSGAGDTVLSVLAVCISNKLAIKQSLELSNRAARIVVGKVGTSTISLNELFKEEKTFLSKKNTLLELKKIVTEYKNKNIKVGFTNGCFDILHLGHINYLEESKKLCDKLIVAINSDTSVKKIKGKNRPINTQAARVKVLSSLKFCDHIIIFNQPTPLKLITSLEPHIITKGGDYEKEKVVGYKEIKKWNGKVHIINFTQGMSSTSIIKKLN
mgnify:CR=1 FL=1